MTDQTDFECELRDSPHNEHKLIGKWNLYYHLPHDKNWDLSSYKSIMKNIETAERLISINENLNENIIKHCIILYNYILDLEILIYFLLLYNINV